MKINEFALSRLRNREHFQFFTSFRDLVLLLTAVALKIEVLFNAFLAAYANELDALDVIRKNAISDDLVNADDERDSMFRGFCDAVKSALNHFDDEVRAAAKRLQIVLNTYGNLTIKPYDDETGGINSLIHDLKTTYAADVAMVKLTEWATALETKNKAFDDLKNNRYSEEAAKTIFRMKQERVKTDAIYHQITERMNALIVVEGEAVYGEFVNELNSRIKEYSNNLAVHHVSVKKAAITTTKTT